MPSLVTLLPNWSTPSSLWMVSVWPVEIPGLVPVPVRVFVPVKVKYPPPALVSSSRVALSMMTGLPVSEPPRWVNVRVSCSRVPLLEMLPPALSKEAPLRMYEPDDATVKVPSLVVVVTASPPSDSVAPLSIFTVPSLVRLARRKRVPPLPTTVVRVPSLVRV